MRVPEVPLLEHVYEPSHDVHVGVQLDLTRTVKQDIVVVLLPQRVLSKVFLREVKKNKKCWSNTVSTKKTVAQVDGQYSQNLYQK